MPVEINAVREREPWGPGGWYAEVVDAVSRAVILSTDYVKGGRVGALEAGRRVAESRGFNVVAC
jgi:hypothetical protein